MFVISFRCDIYNLQDEEFLQDPFGKPCVRTYPRIQQEGEAHFLPKPMWLMNPEMAGGAHEGPEGLEQNHELIVHERGQEGSSRVGGPGSH